MIEVEEIIDRIKEKQVRRSNYKRQVEGRALRTKSDIPVTVTEISLIDNKELAFDHAMKMLEK